MTKTRNISGIPDDLWAKARNQYGDQKISENIKRLLEKDLKNKDADEKKKPILTDTELLDKQKKIVRRLVEKEVDSFNIQQWRKFLNGFYTRKDYKRKASNEISINGRTPYEVKNGGLKSAEFGCVCGASITLAAYNNKEVGCPNCGRHL